MILDLLRDDTINLFWSKLKDELGKQAGFELGAEWGDINNPAELLHTKSGNSRHTGFKLIHDVVLEYRAESCGLFVGAFPGIDRANELHESICRELKNMCPQRYHCRLVGGRVLAASRCR